MARQRGGMGNYLDELACRSPVQKSTLLKRKHFRSDNYAADPGQIHLFCRLMAAKLPANYAKGGAQKYAKLPYDSPDRQREGYEDAWGDRPFER